METSIYLREKTKPAIDWTEGVRYEQKVLGLIGIFTLLRLLLAYVFELGNDEAYYWLYAQQLQWNYFDHPPMIAVWVKLFSLNLTLESEVFIRLSSIVSAGFATWFLFKAVATFHSKKAGWYAAILYTASFYGSIVAGLFIMPDSPQMLFWTLSMWMMARVCNNPRSWVSWILFGLASGLCIMSKVHGVFLWIGLATYILSQKREWLRQPHVYVAILVSLLIASPILLWNIENDFITYKFHSERVIVKHFGLYAATFLKEITGQFFCNNPFNVTLIILGLINWYRGRIKQHSVLPIYIYTGVSLAGLLLMISMFTRTFAHWSGPAYVSLIPIGAVYLAGINVRVYPRILKLALAGFLLFVITWPLATYFYPGTVGNKASTHLGKGDVTLDMFGWRQAGELFTAFYEAEVKSGAVPINTPLVCTTWWGAHTEYYFARRAGIPMMGLGTPKNIHHYLWTNSLRKDKVNPVFAYTIVPADENLNVPANLLSYYSNAVLVKTIIINRSNRPAHIFYVYKLSGWQNNLPTRENIIL